MKTKNKDNKFGTVTVILAMILTAALIIALALNVCNKTRVVYVPAPDSASSDFSGTMLSDYDSLRIDLAQDEANFKFGNILLKDYAFVILDIVNSAIEPIDTYGIEYGPVVSDSSIDLMNESSVGFDDNGQYEQRSTPFFPVHYNAGDFTYIFDLRNIESGNITLFTYFDGKYHYQTTVDCSIDITLNSFKIWWGGDESSSQMYHFADINSLYLYGFEDASKSTIGDYLVDHSLNLSDCKDSLLYQGE